MKKLLMYDYGLINELLGEATNVRYQDLVFSKDGENILVKWKGASSWRLTPDGHVIFPPVSISGQFA